MTYLMPEKFEAMSRAALPPRPSKICYIMRGLPGSGKSTQAFGLGSVGGPHWNADFRVISTDDYWYRPDGTYDFNGSLLKKAHELSFNKFKNILIWTESIQLQRDSVVVLDNTNIKHDHFRRYVEAARSAGYDVKYAYGMAPWAWDPEGCAKHNRHGVPLEVIQRMAAEYEAGDL